MKKTAALLLTILLVSMLGGCYKSDVTFKFGTFDGVEITSSVVAPKETYAQLGFTSLDQNVSSYDIENVNKQIANPDEHITLERIDANGNVLPEGTAFPEDGGMIGTRMRAKYKSLDVAKNSMVIQHNLMITPLTKDESGYGLEVQKNHGLFGTKYIVSGQIHVQGSALHQMYASQLVAANPEVLDNASSTVNFKFPLCFGKNGDKTFVGTTLSYTVTKDNPAQDVYFEVTVLNPLVLGMAILILILLAVIIILLVKKKDTPDAFFVDADGNEIPVFDAVDDEMEDMEEQAEEVEECLEEAAEEIAADEEETAEDTEE
ncbi:MAG: hypothetical protein IJN74_00165 [Clostridia bacterium]|nr:hypothetical protein [Clostridia bacterium]